MIEAQKILFFGLFYCVKYYLNYDRGDHSLGFGVKI